MQPALPISRHPVREVFDTAHENLGVVHFTALAPALTSGSCDGENAAEEREIKEDGSVRGNLEGEKRGRVEDRQEKQDSSERAGDERDETGGETQRQKPEGVHTEHPNCNGRSLTA